MSFIMIYNTHVLYYNAHVLNFMWNGRYVIGLPKYHFDAKLFASKNTPYLMIDDGVR